MKNVSIHYHSPHATASHSQTSTEFNYNRSQKIVVISTENQPNYHANSK